MKFLIVFCVCRFMAEQISVCTSVKEALVALVFHLTQGKRDRTVRKFPPDHGDEICDPILSHKRIFPALKDESATSERVAAPAAG